MGVGRECHRRAGFAAGPGIRNEPPNGQRVSPRPSATGGGDSQSPTLTLAAKVSGLYVFNVDGDGGFVVVSNDDRTTPILGYGDSGAFSTIEMPSNMRAWLQGYADEIAWL